MLFIFFFFSIVQLEKVIGSRSEEFYLTLLLLTVEEIPAKIVAKKKLASA